MKIIENRYSITSYIKAFDLDGTLVNTRSGKVFPKHEEDFELSPLAYKLKDEGNPILIFTNQTYKKNKNMYVQRIRNIIEQLELPCDVYIALDKKVKKPNIKMLREFINTYENKMNKVNRFLYVGDAAGRLGDHSDSDRAFAHNANVLFDMMGFNIKVKFLTPEKYMGKPDISMNWLGFDPVQYLNKLGKTKLKQEEKMKNLIKTSHTLIITVGPPGSGKTTFAKRLKLINPDLLILDEQNSKKELRLLEESEGPVIISRTNPSEEKRQQYIEVHPEWEHIIIYWDDIEVAKHVNRVRHELGKKFIPNVAYNKYLSNLDEPEEYIHWKFDGSFTSEEEMYYFIMRY